MFDINWLGVVLAALAGFVVGGIWYGPIMGKKWMGAVGLSEEQIKEGNMPLIYGGAFAWIWHRAGDLPWWILAVVVLLTVLALVFRRRRATAREEGE